MEMDDRVDKEISEIQWIGVEMEKELEERSEWVTDG